MFFKPSSVRIVSPPSSSRIVKVRIQLVSSRLHLTCASISFMERSRDMKQAFVYILASQKNGTLYIGVTSNLERRLAQHREGTIDGFTKRYKVHRLVYFEAGSSIEGAIFREKQLKGWYRARKIQLIEKHNPEWRDLLPEDGVE